MIRETTIFQTNERNEEIMSEKFTVIFYDDDRKTILDKQEVSRGSSVKYSGKMPVKAEENGIKYEFVGWDTTGNIDCVTENIELFAKYEAGKIDAFFELSEANAELANLNEIMQAGQKVSGAEKATRDLTAEQKRNLVNEIKEKGSVDLEPQNEFEK